jgi:hypothetical protein
MILSKPVLVFCTCKVQENYDKIDLSGGPIILLGGGGGGGCWGLHHIKNLEMSSLVLIWAPLYSLYTFVRLRHVLNASW